MSNEDIYSSIHQSS